MIQSSTWLGIMIGCSAVLWVVLSQQAKVGGHLLDDSLTLKREDKVHRLDGLAHMYFSTAASESASGYTCWRAASGHSPLEVARHPVSLKTPFRSSDAKSGDGQVPTGAVNAS